MKAYAYPKMSTAGDVGNLTGYGGYTPSSRLQSITTKPATSIRAPSTDRAQSAHQFPSSSPTEHAPPASLVLPRTSASEYGAHYSTTNSTNNSATREINTGPTSRVARSHSVDSFAHPPTAVHRSLYRDEFGDKTATVIEEKTRTARHVESQRSMRCTDSTQVRLAAAYDLTPSYSRDFIPSRGRKMSDPSHITQLASTGELFDGTPKRTAFTPGYAGHVPANTDTLSRTHMPTGIDETRAHTKDNLMASTHTELPGYGGYQPRDISNDRGLGVRFVPESGKSMYTSTFRGTGELPPASPNRRTNRVRHDFFVANAESEGPDGRAAAERFFVENRPMEGMPSIGDTPSRRWLPDNQLKRTYMFQST